MYKNFSATHRCDAQALQAQSITQKLLKCWNFALPSLKCNSWLRKMCWTQRWNKCNHVNCSLTFLYSWLHSDTFCCSHSFAGLWRAVEPTSDSSNRKSRWRVQAQGIIFSPVFYWLLSLSFCHTCPRTLIFAGTSLSWFHPPQKLRFNHHTCILLLCNTSRMLVVLRYVGMICVMRPAFKSSRPRRTRAPFGHSMAPGWSLGTPSSVQVSSHRTF